MIAIKSYPLFYCLNNNKIANVRIATRLPSKPYKRVLGANGIVIYGRRKSIKENAIIDINKLEMLLFLHIEDSLIADGRNINILHG